MERCEECGFDYEGVDRDQVGRRVAASAAALAALVRAEPEPAQERPDATRWSAVEYTAHVRDVLLVIRDRIVIGLVEDDPGFKPLYRDERIALGLYRADPPVAVAGELEAAAAMFVRLFGAVDRTALGRPVQFGFPDPVARTVGWMGVQAVHECEHHEGDVRENLRRLART
jgi:hypothetical protein